MVIKNKLLPLYPGCRNNPTDPAGSGTKKDNTMITIEDVKNAAREFLRIADELNERVSRYIDFSDAPEDIAAYNTVMAAEKKFVDAANTYYGESWKCSLNYELAESFI